eukprot:6214767-Pleurochrysis_carterae.AAC.1
MLFVTSNSLELWICCSAKLVAFAGSQVFLEAQAAGLAVVGPRAVAVPSAIKEHITGKLYRPLDMDDARLASF